MPDVDDRAANAAPRTTSLIILAVLATVAALYFARDLLVPIVFALLLNALLRPILRLLKRWAKIPTPIGAAIVILALMALLTAGAFSAAGPVQHWVGSLPQRFDAAQGKVARLRAPVKQVTDVTKKIEQATQEPSTQPALGPAPKGPGLGATILGTAAGFFTGLLEVLLLAYLLLASGDLFYHKLLKVMPMARDKTVASQVVDDTNDAVFRYIAATFFINLGQAVVIALILWWIGMPNALLWGLATVVLEFIPYLGASIMIAMLTIVAFATFNSIGHILAVPASYFTVTTIQNNVVSPYAYGSRLKMNPVAVLIAVLFFWFLWGIAGAFLAVPIFATIMIVSARTERFKPLAEFLAE